MVAFIRPGPSCWRSCGLSMAEFPVGGVVVKTAATAEDYARVFEKERQNVYPVVDAFEQRMGYAIDKAKLEDAARVLACPVKKNPPNWQHGRILYAAVREYLSAMAKSFQRGADFLGAAPEHINVLEVGTAKGFGALCLQWALDDSGLEGEVTTVDVINPNAKISRNTVAELGGPLTLDETMAQWPERYDIHTTCSTGIDWLETHPERIHVAFVDGKHTGPVVAKEGWLLSQRQVSGDLAIFDDVHLPDIAKAVDGLNEYYTFERIDVLPTRAYAVGVRK